MSEENAKKAGYKKIMHDTVDPEHYYVEPGESEESFDKKYDKLYDNKKEFKPEKKPPGRM